MKRVLIIGNGWLGNRLKEIYPNALIVDSYETVRRSISSYDVLINAAAKTNIDDCEKDKVTCFMSNVQLAGDLADLCYKLGKRYVFISSACIFESRNIEDVKDETSYPNPGCFYALTKWMAEEMITAINPFSVIIRIRLPISETPHPRNTITKILKYPYLNNSQESVTVIEDMLPVFKQLVDDPNKQGIFHLINAGTISPAEIGTAFGHTFTEQTKEEQDIRMKWEGKARRVSTVAISTKVPMLPDIKERLPQIVLTYNAAKIA